MNHHHPSTTISHRAVIIGGAGNVGKGILQTFSSRSETWDVIAVDPAFEEEQKVEVMAATEVKVLKTKLKLNESGQNIKSKIEDIDDEIFQSWFFPSLGENKNGHVYNEHYALLQYQRQHQHNHHHHHHHHVEIIVTNENGNRDEYANRPNLGAQNDSRFTRLVKRIVAAREYCNKIQNESSDSHLRTSVHISYIGGSWTRLQPASKPIHAEAKKRNHSEVNDTSLVKEGGGSNPYEIAKSCAQANARKLSTQYNVGITFYDYISVVPNFAPNFSVSRMINAGLENGIIKYSAGNYGRPLLHTKEAGEIVMKIVERDILSSIQYSKGGVNDDEKRLFNNVLIPGHFITFKIFAEVAKETIENKHKNKNIAYEVYENTPDELRMHCTSLRESVDSSSSSVIDGLKETAVYTLKQYEEEL